MSLKNAVFRRLWIASVVSVCVSAYDTALNALCVLLVIGELMGGRRADPCSAVQPPDHSEPQEAGRSAKVNRAGPAICVLQLSGKWLL